MANESKTPVRSIVSGLLMGFAILSLVTAFILSSSDGDELLSENVSVSGTEHVVGPFNIEEPNTIVYTRVWQNMPVNTWSHVTVSLLNSQKQYLMGFSDGFWHEEGYDDGYYWNEQVNVYDTKVVVQEPGDYYLDVSPESNFSGREKTDSTINISVSTGGLSYVPHLAAGVLALIVVLLLRVFGSFLPGAARA